jgi:hypothetical protein
VLLRRVAQALKLRRRILAGLESIDVPEEEDGDEIAALASLVTVMLKARNTTVEELAMSMQKPHIGHPARQLLLEAEALRPD